MARDITGPEWGVHLTTFERTAFRLETRAEYLEPYEAEPFRAWLAGRAPDLSYMHDWLDGVRAATAAGKRYERVRVLAEPPTPYQQWEMDVATLNAEAGEDIRVLDATEAAALQLGDQDFWLLDDSAVAVMHFSPEFVGATRYDTADPVDAPMVEACRAIRDRAWRHARPFTEHPALRSV